jgi:energy-coupling factor transporter ATP-binding protein EcfA2
VSLPAYGRNVLLCGQSGSGKSTLVTGLLERIIQSDLSVVKTSSCHSINDFRLYRQSRYATLSVRNLEPNPARVTGYGASVKSLIVLDHGVLTTHTDSADCCYFIPLVGDSDTISR